ncbi:MAG: helix-turn-helix domain-containing protein [Actinobacteria bacterium]|nr:MAG: helix-turn-helix domain-containing protein [Actinomycetota bacterium]
MESQITSAVGKRLRKVRVQNKYSLKEVEKMTKGEVKASILGAYERGERVISVPRLFELSQFFNVPVEYLLADSAISPKETDTSAAVDDKTGIKVDLIALNKLPDKDVGPIKTYVNNIKKMREDFNLEVITIRQSDIRAIAAMYQTEPENVNKRLNKLDLVRS